MQSLLFRIMITTTKNIYYKNTLEHFLLHFFNARVTTITPSSVYNQTTTFSLSSLTETFLRKQPPLVSRQGFQVMGIKLFAQITL